MESRAVSDKPSTQQIALQILPHLWTGNAKCANSRPFFLLRQISAVLNLDRLPCYFATPRGEIQYLTLGILQSVSQRDNRRFYEKLELATEYMHCFGTMAKKALVIVSETNTQGTSALVMAYLIKYHGYNLKKARAYLSERDSQAFSDNVPFFFEPALLRWCEKYHNNKS